MSNMVKSKVVIDALKSLSRKNDGVLSPEVVVDAAKSVKSPLHRFFEWEDTEAARKYRIYQARQLLRVVVEYIGDSKEPVRVFVSLMRDRTGEETGYRTTVNVVTDSALYAQMLNDALNELRIFKEKYARVKELQEVFTAIEAIRV